MISTKKKKNCPKSSSFNNTLFFDKHIKEIRHELVRLKDNKSTIVKKK